MTNTMLFPSSSVRIPKTTDVHTRFHSSVSHLPDLVTDCEHRLAQKSTTEENLRITCKEIAHSLRLVADQVDRKYCQDTDFNRNLHYLSIRLLFQSMFCTLWTQSLLPYILLFCKAKTLFC